jgi:hypothetical protein
LEGNKEGATGAAEHSQFQERDHRDPVSLKDPKSALA